MRLIRVHHIGLLSDSPDIRQICPSLHLAAQAKVYEGAEKQLDAAMERLGRRREEEAMYGKGKQVSHLLV